MNRIVIIPALNPDECLKDIVDRNWELENQIIVVDDGSDERYRRFFWELSEKCIVLHHDKNRGKGAAVKTALQYIKTELWEANVIGIMDADGQHLPDDMERCLMKAAGNPKALILGSRNMDDTVPWKSKIGNLLTKKVFRLMTGTEVSDTQTGLRAFSSELLDFMLDISGERYEYEMNVLVTCAKQKVEIIEIPIQTIYHDKDNSCSHFRKVRDSLRIYKELLKFSMISFSSFLLDYLLFGILIFLLPGAAWQVTAANGNHKAYGKKISYVLADIYVGDITCLQTAFAQNTYGVGYEEKLTDMSADMKSILAINGDSYSNDRHKDNGTIIRNGVIYRSGATDMETCILNWDGTMKIYSPKELNTQRLIDEGAYQSWIFGPSLLDGNGKAKNSFQTWDYIRQSHPRTAIGYYEPGHYCLLVVDGRQENTRGMFLNEMAALFEQLGCKTAYNLDGGHCSFMTKGTQIVNHPYKPEHKVQDGIFLTEGI